MKNLLYIILLALPNAFDAQTGNIGINTILPDSMLTVNGSIAGQDAHISIPNSLTENRNFSLQQLSTP